jgi:protein involved in polysaccharide export with SLBB domain
VTPAPAGPSAAPSLMLARPSLVLAFLSLLLAGCVGPGEETPDLPPMNVEGQVPAEQATYRLRARDFVRVGVLNEADTFVERRINPDGTIDIPFLGQDSLVKVAGLTMTEAQALLASRYARFFKAPVVTVEIRGYAERRIYVRGSVGRSGPVAIPPEESLTLTKALANAGGILRGGNRSAVAIHRLQPDGTRRTFEVNVRKIDLGESPDIPLEDDDHIFVRESRI